MSPQKLELFPGDLFVRKGDAAPAGDTRKSKASGGPFEIAKTDAAREPDGPEASAIRGSGQEAEGSAAGGAGAGLAADSGAPTTKRDGKARRSKTAAKGSSSVAAPAASVLEFRLLDEVSEDLDEILRCAEGRASPAPEPEDGEEAPRAEALETEDHEAETLEARPPEVEAAKLMADSQPLWRSVSRTTLAGTIAVLLLLVGALLAGWFATRPDTMPSPKNTTPAATLEGKTSAPETAPPIEGQDESPSVPRSDPKAPEEAANQGPATGNNDGIAPRVDVVRVEEDGSAVIAGIAAPGTELIVLHNDAPIGVAKSDAFGEWVLLPEEPLAEGPHEFGLVVKSVEGSVTLPDASAPQSEAPAADESGGEAGDPPALDQESRLPAPGSKPAQAQVNAPVPPQKPMAGSSPQEKAPYVVQLASAPSAVGAASEWQRLRRAHPELLAQQKLSVQEADLAERGAVYRVRTGSFDSLAAARQFCAAFRRQKQDCLVVKRTEAVGAESPRTRLTRYDSW